MRRAGKPKGRAGVWAAIRRFHGAWTLAELRESTDIDRTTIRRFVLALVQGGYVSGVAADRGGAAAIGYRLVNDCGAEPPRLKPDGSPSLHGRATENLWRTMKIITRSGGDFDYRDLAIQARAGGVKPSFAHARMFIHHLFKAGYLAPSGALLASRATRFRLVKDTGGKPPLVRSMRCVYDRNLDTLVWHEAVP